MVRDKARLALQLLLGGICACGEATTPSTNLRFRLAEVDGQPVPATLDSTVTPSDTVRVLITGGELRVTADTISFGSARQFRADSTTHVSLSLRWEYSDSVRTATREVLGTFSLSQGWVSICWNHQYPDVPMCDNGPYDPTELVLRQLLQTPPHEVRFLRI